MVFLPALRRKRAGRGVGGARAQVARLRGRRTPLLPSTRCPASPPRWPPSTSPPSRAGRRRPTAGWRLRDGGSSASLSSPAGTGRRSFESNYVVGEAAPLSARVRPVCECRGATPQRLIARGYRRQRPYICSNREIANLITAAHGLAGTAGLRPLVFARLLALPLLTGMRTSEMVRCR